MSIISSQTERRQRQQARREVSLLVWALILAAVLATVGRQPAAQAAVFPIPCGDVAALITAINTANRNGQNDTINLAACVYTLTAVQNDTDGPNGLPSIVSRITLKGAGADRTIITRSNFGDLFRILHVASSGVLVLDGLTITGGALQGESSFDNSANGGGIFNRGGTITVTHSTIRDNSVWAHGGGILNDEGTVTVTHSTISGNCAGGPSGDGGGLLNSFGTMTITNSTVSNNSAGSGDGLSGGGGISNNGTMTITNSTISGNVTESFGDSGNISGGGGIVTSGTLTVRHSTITDNVATDIWEGRTVGGGISGTATLTHTIVAGNSADDAALHDCAGGIISQGHNLVGASSGCPRNGPGDRTVTPQAFTTVLGPLQNNGGPTLTHALRQGSPAINAGSSTCTTPDQRGVPRPQGAACDIGAVEFIVATSTLAWQNFPLAPQTGTFTAQYEVVPNQNRMNAVTGLAFGAVRNNPNQMGVIVRFNPSGYIDAFNGTAYTAATAVPYTAGTRYFIRLVINVVQHTYSVYVRPAGGTEQILATNYAFRTEQRAVPQLDTWALKTWTGSHTVSNFTLGVTSTLAWQNFPFDPQTTFTAQFEAVPHKNRMNAVTGLAFGPVSSNPNKLAVIVRFNPSGYIDAFNRTAYTATTAVSYTAGTRYFFRLVVDVDQHTYSVYVRPAGGTEQILATNYAFRIEQGAVPQLDTWALKAWVGSHTVESFSVSAIDW